MERTPYWGELPPPKVSRGNSVKRERDQTQRGNHDLSIDTSVMGDRRSSQSQAKSNRYSTQTDAPTLSTQSPFASPIASEFRGDGLAPRPPSYPYGSTDAPRNDEFYERRRRREARNREQNAQAAAPPPAAPDVPKAPPLSYRPPQSTTSRQPYAQEALRLSSGRRAEDTVGRSRTVDDKRQKDPRIATVGHARRSSNANTPARDRALERLGEGDLVRANSERSQPRKTSISEAEAQRRREWAPDRSPLQRLELTLDGITKEEKRARVEEAELLAREAKAGRGGERVHSNSVRTRNRAAVATPEGTIEPEPQTLPEAGLIRSLSSKQKEQLQRSGTVERKRPVEEKVPSLDQGFEYEPGPDVITTRSNEPERSDSQRRPSVREKAVPTASGALPVGGVVRSTSNKLRKNPPGDPWHNRRHDAEKQYVAVEPRQAAVQPQGQNSKLGLANSQSINRGNTTRGQPKYDTDKALPPPPPSNKKDQIETYSDDDIDTVPVRRGTTSKIEQLTGQKATPGGIIADHPEDQEIDAKPVRRGTVSKIERLMGQRPSVDAENRPPQSNEDLAVKPVRRGSLLQRLTGAVPRLSPQRTQSARTSQDVRTEVVKVNGVKYDVPRPLSASSSHSSGSDSNDDYNRGGHRRLHLSDVLHRHQNASGHGSYLAGPRLDEWKKGGVALLAGPLLDLDTKDNADVDKDKTWWEAGDSGKQKRNSTKQRKAEAYDGEYDEKSAPTRFKPPLFLKCGPLLRYCGLRQEKVQSRSGRKPASTEREIWRGSIMIVTEDTRSSYELAPTLRLFLQPIDLMPPPPEEVNGGELAPEYIDPLAGLPRVGRDGRTLYIRPIDHLEEAKDLSQEESDEGLFEMHRSPLDGVADKKPLSLKPHYDGEKAGKYKEVRGFRLHAEHGVTFWRFNIEVELRDKQQRIAYRINRGPATAFWVPAKDQPMSIMFYSCNGFSHDIDPNKFSGPDPMWRDVLNTHQTRPFHVMLGGGDQVYNDPVMDETVLFREWLEMRDPLHKARIPFTAEMQEELEQFYLNRYAMWFSQGLFGVANSQIPMVNIFDDHDIIDGFGSYPDHYMRSAVMSGLGSVAFKYYMLFQHQSSIDEGEETEPSWILGTEPGPYIRELSRTVFTSLGRSIAFLGLDCRTERMNDEVVSAETYHKIFDRLEKEIVKGNTKHLIVMVGVPMAYPRMVWLENILTSRAIAPLKAMGRAGWLGKGILNKFDGGVEVLDDLDDHWTARHHKEERNWFIQELQDLAAEKSVRVTLLGGDVHLAAIGQFYSNPKLAIPKHKDPRYMPNIISSAIVNTPPPNTLADILNRRDKIHHLDDVTDEDMIPIFTHDVNGKPRNNKRLLNRRNWCSIRAFDPAHSPPPSPISESPMTPPQSGPRGNLFRRLSNRGPSYRPDAAVGTPPLSNQGFFARRPSVSTPRRNSSDSQRPGMLTRTLSLTRKDFMPGLFRRNGRKRRDEINGYGSETDEDAYYTDEQTPPAQTQHRSPAQQRVGLRGGSGGPENGRQAHDSYFPPVDTPQDEQPSNRLQKSPPASLPPRTKFHRTPTGLSEKQARKADGNMDINLEGGLDICLNVEVNQRDPAGITMPYRMLVPALWYEEEEEGRINKKQPAPVAERPTGLKRLLSVGRRPSQQQQQQQQQQQPREEEYPYSDEEQSDTPSPEPRQPTVAAHHGSPGVVSGGNSGVRRDVPVVKKGWY